jgi:hypothetical protein
MNGSEADAVIREAGRMIERGEIPDDLTIRLLWAGMVWRSRQDGKLRGRVNLVAGTQAVLMGALTLIGGALLRHLGG